MQPEKAAVAAASWSMAAVAIPSEEPALSKAEIPPASATAAQFRAARIPPTRPSSITTNDAAPERTTASTSWELWIDRLSAIGTSV